MSAARKKIEIIQALRGVAAMLVVLFHARDLVDGPRWLDLGARAFGNGAVGVDLFFLISGFIMVHVTAHAGGSLRDVADFLARRVARIWPVYAVATLIAVALHPPGFLVGITRASVLEALGKALVFYPQSADNAPFLGYAPLSVGWTLNYEVWFYLLFALSLLAGRWRWLALAALFVATLIGIPLALGVPLEWTAYHGYRFEPAILNVIASPFLWEFALGIVIGHIYRSRIRLRSEVVRTSFVVVAGTAVAWQYGANVWGGHGITGWGPAMAVLFLAIMLADKERPIAPPRWLVWLGDVSFSLYLMHRFVQANLVIELGKIAPAGLFEGGPFFVASTALALLLAHLSHRYLERGLAERAQRWLVARIRARRAPRLDAFGASATR